MIEIWRDIKDYEGLYQVSNFGRVKNVRTSKILKVKEHTRGYLKVCLCKDGKTKQFFVHRLVAQAFIPNPLNLPQVNHKIEGEEGKKINTVENLEWCDAKYNMNYGTRNEKVSKPVLQFSKNGCFVKEWSSVMEVQRQLGYGQGHISNCCNGKLKSAYGYIWRYK